MRTAFRAFRWILRVTAIVVLAGAVSLFLNVAVFSGPQIVDRVRSPSAEEECAQMRAGMSRKEVIQIIHRKVPPQIEYVDAQGRMTFSRADGGCEVDFGVDGDRVSAVHLNRQARTVGPGDE